MPKSLSISCDAPGCNQRKQETNNWWVIRRHTASNRSFIALSLSEADERDGDQFICSFKCMHIMFDDYMQGSVNDHRKDLPAANVEVIEISHG